MDRRKVSRGWIGPAVCRSSFGDRYRLWVLGDTGYAVRYARTCDGVELPRPRYSLAYLGRTISRHKTKHAAMQAAYKQLRNDGRPREEARAKERKGARPLVKEG